MNKTGYNAAGLKTICGSRSSGFKPSGRRTLSRASSQQRAAGESRSGKGSLPEVSAELRIAKARSTDQGQSNARTSETMADSLTYIGGIRLGTGHGPLRDLTLEQFAKNITISPLLETEGWIHHG